LNPSGGLVGTPTTAGVYTFTAQVSDANSPAQTDTKSCTIIITHVEEKYKRQEQARLVAQFAPGPVPVFADAVLYGDAADERFEDPANQQDAGRRRDLGVDRDLRRHQPDRQLRRRAGSTTPALLHIATQELTTGRVSYHQFSMATDAWTIADEQIKASVTTHSRNWHLCVRIGFAARRTVWRDRRRV